jgi:hypothetical protein
MNARFVRVVIDLLQTQFVRCGRAAQEWVFLVIEFGRVDRARTARELYAVLVTLVSDDRGRSSYFRWSRFSIHVPVNKSAALTITEDIIAATINDRVNCLIFIC